MLVPDAGRAVALASIALALALDQLTLAQIAVVAFVEGSLFVFFQLSEGAALPHVVPKEQLPTALAQNQAREQGCRARRATARRSLSSGSVAWCHSSSTQ